MATKTTSTIAREDSGNIQLTFNISWDEVKKAKDEVLREIAKEATLPGFRKGNAPISKVEAATPRETLIQQTLAKILPKAIADSFDEHKIRPAIYPKLEVLSAGEGKPWQVRGITCELPEVDLGNYKQIVKSASKSQAIWTPDKTKAEVKELSNEEKQQQVLKALLESIKVAIPQILIEEEANARLSRLLERIEKLGLTLDGYLSSTGKTAQQLRQEYESQVRESLTLDLILDKVGAEQKIKVEEAKVDEVIKASAADPSLKENMDTPEQRRLITSVLRRRASLDYLVGLL